MALVEGTKEIEVMVEIGWQFLALVAALVTTLATAWASGAFYELLVSLSPLLRPVELSLNSNNFPPEGNVGLRVCVAEWMKADELVLVVVSPEGALLYSDVFKRGSDNCMTVVVALRSAVEGVYTVAVIRRNIALSVARFKVAG